MFEYIFILNNCTFIIVQILVVVLVFVVMGTGWDEIEETVIVDC